MKRDISFTVQQLWVPLCCTNLLHHRLRDRPQFSGFLKLLLLHCLLHRLRRTANIVQAIIVQQRLHSKETQNSTHRRASEISLFLQMNKHSNICFLFVTYSSIEVWSPRHYRVCGWNTSLTVRSLVSFLFLLLCSLLPALTLFENIQVPTCVAYFQ